MNRMCGPFNPPVDLRVQAYSQRSLTLSPSPSTPATRRRPRSPSWPGCMPPGTARRPPRTPGARTRWSAGSPARRSTSLTRRRGRCGLAAGRRTMWPVIDGVCCWGSGGRRRPAPNRRAVAGCARPTPVPRPNLFCTASDAAISSGNGSVLSASLCDEHPAAAALAVHDLRPWLERHPICSSLKRGGYFLDAGQNARHDQCG
jgi:hypothetical protein